MIEIRDIRKSFGKQEVIKGLDLHIGQGGITAVLGPNGSGKTTLIKSILGLVIPDSGQILLNGKKTEGRHTYRKEIGYLPQIARFPENLKVTELISMVEDIRNQKGDHEPLIDLFELQFQLNKRFRALSGGTKQKVNLLLALMFECPLYILDEPTSGLDPVALIRLKELINNRKNNGKTFLVTTHIMNLVEEIADQLIFLLEGRVYFKGTFNEMTTMQGEDNLERAIARILEKENAENSKV